MAQILTLKQINAAKRKQAKADTNELKTTVQSTEIR